MSTAIPRPSRTQWRHCSPHDHGIPRLHPAGQPRRAGGQQDFSDLTFTINGSEFRYGHFLNALVTFLTIAAVVFFLVIKPINALMERRQVETPVDEQTRDCPECRSDIPVLANRCAFCTAEVGRADAPG
jgi:large conductance mechanosensitive channel